MKKLTHVPTFATIVLLSLTLFHRPLASQAPPSATPTLRGDGAHPPQTLGWVDTRLYFGLGPADAPQDASGSGITEAQWRDFLDREVTPRFPSGLSVLDVYGQWQSAQQTAQGKPPSRERSKLLIIDYPATADNAARIEAIRSAWKQRTHAQSVLRVTEAADVSF